MAGIKAPIKDLLSLLQDIEGLAYVRVWNNQFKLIHEGKMQAIPFPAAFVEIVAPEKLVTIGVGVVAGDLLIRIHLCDEMLDAGDGTMEQNLEIFDLKDKLVKALSGFAPTACSAMQRVSESQSYDHDNTYEYILEFDTHFIDSKGSKYDEETTDMIEYGPPTVLEIDNIESGNETNSQFTEEFSKEFY
jgi:hypothetical protein